MELFAILRRDGWADGAALEAAAADLPVTEIMQILADRE